MISCTNVFNINIGLLADMDLEQLNEVCLVENTKQLVKLLDLTINEKHSIYKATLSNTKYGRSIFLHLETKLLFLPRRVTETFESQLNHFVEGKNALVVLS